MSLSLNTGLSACHKESQTCEVGADEKERGLCGCQQSEKMSDSCLKAHLSAGRCFYKEGEQKQNKEIKGRGGKVLYVQTSTVHSFKDVETDQVMVQCVSSWSLSSYLLG